MSDLMSAESRQAAKALGRFLGTREGQRLAARHMPAGRLVIPVGEHESIQEVGRRIADHEDDALLAIQRADGSLEFIEMQASRGASEGAQQVSPRAEIGMVVAGLSTHGWQELGQHLAGRVLDTAS